MLELKLNVITETLAKSTCRSKQAGNQATGKQREQTSRGSLQARCLYEGHWQAP